jgi:hypothetical protein
MRSMPGPLPPTVTRAHARRFYEPSRFGRTVSTISIAAKTAVGIETRSEGQDGATGGFGCPGMGPPSRAGAGLGRAASVAHALPAPSLPHLRTRSTRNHTAHARGKMSDHMPSSQGSVLG